MASTEESRWRSWPDGEAGKQLVHVLVACSVDSLYRTLFGPASAFVVRMNPVIEPLMSLTPSPPPSTPAHACLWPLLFRCIPARPAAQLEAHGARGNKGYVETAWLGSEADADAAQLPTVSPKPSASDAQQKLPTKGQARRVAFSSVGMGMKVPHESCISVPQRMLMDAAAAHLSNFSLHARAS